MEFAGVVEAVGSAVDDFALLGSRYAKYDRLQWELAAEAERRLPADLRLIDRASLVLLTMSFLPR